jgi:hypothetical protein
MDELISVSPATDDDEAADEDESRVRTPALA